MPRAGPRKVQRYRWEAVVQAVRSSQWKGVEVRAVAGALEIHRFMCNRGVSGKSDLVPGIRLLERLSTRNEFLIDSHHSLRDALVAQIGGTETERRGFLNARHMEARASLIHEWESTEVGESLL